MQLLLCYAQKSPNFRSNVGFAHNSLIYLIIGGHNTGNYGESLQEQFGFLNFEFVGLCFSTANLLMKAVLSILRKGNHLLRTFLARCMKIGIKGTWYT